MDPKDKTSVTESGLPSYTLLYVYMYATTRGHGTCLQGYSERRKLIVNSETSGDNDGFGFRFKCVNMESKSTPLTLIPQAPDHPAMINPTKPRCRSLSGPG